MNALWILLPVVAVTQLACSNKFDECIEKQKTEYRARTPSASYGQVQSKQAEFEMMCSSLKGK